MGVFSLRKICFPLFLTLLLTTTLLVLLIKPLNNTIDHKYNGEIRNLFWNYSVLDNLNGNWRRLSQKQVKSLSNLGRILYLDEEYPEVDESAEYKILVWKHGPLLENRHIKHFTKKRFDPFEKCSVNNCKITYNDSDISSADIVLFHLQRLKGTKDLPSQQNRNPKQLWTFLTDESPLHTFMGYKGKLNDFKNVFNWSMTYRMDSDVPVPYGRTTHLNPPRDEEPVDVEEWKLHKNKDVLVAIMGSNCGGNNHRWDYVKELKKHIPVDVYGHCGTLKCPGHFKADCQILSQYMFYLAFENSNCEEYLTEKLWWNAYSKDAIPIVMGSSKDTVTEMLPPHSYIHVEDFASPRDLANYLLYLNNTLSELHLYFQWKNYFEIRNEHGYFQSDSYHYCRVCEALNYNSKAPKIYEDLEKFWSKNDCFPSWNV